MLRRAGASSEFKILFIDNLNVGPFLRDTLMTDKVEHARRGDHRDLQAPAPGRSADAGDGHATCSSTCSSTRSATTSPRSAASS